MKNTIYPWQTKQWENITKQYSDEALPHAFLFTGLKGIGKLHFAQCLVGFLLCERKKESQACGECKQCKLVKAQTHTDLRLVKPEEGSAVIKVDTIRSLVEFFTLSSMQGGLKVAVLCPAEALNHNAANALLKTLEEPAGQSIIILISHASGKLLPTIRSRCQVVDFDTPKQQQAHQWLADTLVQEGAVLPADDDITALLSLSSNAPLRAKEYFEINALNENNRMLDEMGSMLKNDCIVTTISTRWDDDIFSLRLAWTIRWLELILKLKMTGDMKIVQGQHGEKMLQYLADKCSEFQLLALYRESLKQYRLFLGNTNPNKILGFEYLLHQWVKLMSSKGVQ
ncbi:MAG: DNA polymerase-3 subunit delta' [Oleiphilaceae bacterium]|jgi:DNA polymerase-3 subunit delta'